MVLLLFVVVVVVRAVEKNIEEHLTATLHKLCSSHMGTLNILSTCGSHSNQLLHPSNPSISI